VNRHCVYVTVTEYHVLEVEMPSDVDGFDQRPEVIERVKARWDAGERGKAGGRAVAFKWSHCVLPR
jgi:hypothetical protein